jgi:hypothetical protein
MGLSSSQLHSDVLNLAAKMAAIRHTIFCILNTQGQEIGVDHQQVIWGTCLLLKRLEEEAKKIANHIDAIDGY